MASRSPGIRSSSARRLEGSEGSSGWRGWSLTMGGAGSLNRRRKSLIFQNPAATPRRSFRQPPLYSPADVARLSAGLRGRPAASPPPCFWRARGGTTSRPCVAAWAGSSRDLRRGACGSTPSGRRGRRRRDPRPAPRPSCRSSSPRSLPPDRSAPRRLRSATGDRGRLFAFRPRFRDPAVLAPLHSPRAGARRGDLWPLVLRTAKRARLPIAVVNGR
jgi:hypothetical protein